jgi:hypothetical protein
MSLYLPSHNLVMLSVIMVSDVMLSVIMVSDVMLSVVAPQLQLLKPSRQLVEQILQNFFFLRHWRTDQSGYNVSPLRAFSAYSNICD